MNLVVLPAAKETRSAPLVKSGAIAANKSARSWGLTTNKTTSLVFASSLNSTARAPYFEEISPTQVLKSTPRP